MTRLAAFCVVLFHSVWKRAFAHEYKPPRFLTKLVITMKNNKKELLRRKYNKSIKIEQKLFLTGKVNAQECAISNNNNILFTELIYSVYTPNLLSASKTKTIKIWDEGRRYASWNWNYDLARKRASTKSYFHYHPVG